MSLVASKHKSPILILSTLKHYLSRLTDSSTPLLPFIPKPIKLLLLLLFLAQSPSWPFAWHLRVWYYPLKAYWEVYQKGRKKYIDDFERVSQKAGGVKMLIKNTRTAWVDDCDYNMHLSNSCYAKNTDAARMKWCIDALAPLFTPKCHMALGASHYVFIKEIPIGTEYTMETRLGGWDEKWLYLVTEFVIYPKKKPTRKGKDKVVPDIAPVGGPSAIPSISAPPSGSSSPLPDSGTATPSTNIEAVKKSAALRTRAVRADGGVVCALAVTEYCVKAGRMTVPPRIVLHFSMLSPDQKQRDHARSILFGHKDAGFAWLRGGWKEDANAARLGLEIGHDFAEGREVTEEAEWVSKAKDGMQQVVEGLAVF